MTVFLSILEIRDPEVIANHGDYCAKLGYKHEIVCIGNLKSSAHRVLFKYELIAHYFSSMEKNELLICATEDCVIVGAYDAEELLKDRDYLLTKVDCEVRDRQTAIQVWRNTFAIRDIVLEIISKAKLTHGIGDELMLHENLQYLPAYAQLHGCFCTVLCNVRRDPLWASCNNVWMLVLSDVELYAGTPPAFRSALFEHINDRNRKGIHLFQFPSYGRETLDDFEVLNPDGEIAIVMYYTSNIRKFGVIAENNFRRYCVRHGYALYIHHQTPGEASAELGVGVNGTWIKAWLLNRYLPRHEWTIWVDADILFINQSIRLETMLAGRDVLMARDIGPWIVNAGVMGFRCTEGNVALLREIIDRVRAVSDKSSTYASGGDQTIVAEVLQTRIGWRVGDGIDIIALNTPWFFQQDSSLMVHYYGMSTDLRALVMAFQDRGSLGISSRYNLTRI